MPVEVGSRASCKAASGDLGKAEAQTKAQVWGEGGEEGLWQQCSLVLPNRSEFANIESTLSSPRK